ncbi:MAG: alkaline phosphatase family protein [Anaerolineae bacterium]
MGALIVFIDGVGLGDDDQSRNPLAAVRMPTLRRLLDGRPLAAGTVQAAPFSSGVWLRALDATLGVPGLPQSGTGQATLWSGVNLSARLGRHAGPYAPPEARALLQTHNLFAAAGRAGPVAFANAYPPRYLERMARGTARQSVTALAANLGGVPFRGPDEIRAGHAISAFITNELWESRLGVAGVPEITPQDAGVSLARLAQTHDLTVFEFFVTDMAGHRQEEALAEMALTRLDGLLEGALSVLDERRDLLLVTSDHGNLEDQTTSDHTLNPVPGLVWGKNGRAVANSLRGLQDVTPTILRWLGEEPLD